MRFFLLASLLCLWQVPAEGFLPPQDAAKLGQVLGAAVQAFGQIAGNDGDWKGRLNGQWGWLKEALNKQGVQMPPIPGDPGATATTTTGAGQTDTSTTSTAPPSSVAAGTQLVTPQEIACLFKCPASTASQYAGNVNTALQEAGATSAKRIQMFAAQIGHESIGLTQMREIGSSSYCRRYEGRSNLGNTQPGDGCRFKGRGPIQLTGRYNYRVCGQAIGLDLVSNPDSVAQDPAVGFKTTVWFWKKNNLNRYADAGDITGATRKINGGTNGAADRVNRYRNAQRCISDATIQQRLSSASSSTTTTTGGATNTNTNSAPAAAGDTSCDMSSLQPYNCGAAYASGRNLGDRQCVKVQNKPVATNTYCALMRLVGAMRSAGVNFQLNSAFRTQADQTRLYNCYRTRSCNNGNLAARPGYSRHQNGIAFDISTGGNTYAWLSSNASKYGFVRTVSSERWHWEYRPGSRCNQFVRYTCS